MYANNVTGLYASKLHFNETGNTAIVLANITGGYLIDSSIKTSLSKQGLRIVYSLNNFNIYNVRSNITNQYPFWIGNNDPVSEIHRLTFTNNIANSSIQGIELRGNIYDSVFSDNILLNSTGINKHASYSGSRVSISQNFGVAGYGWGASTNTDTATNISAFGAGDTWRNLSKSPPNLCVATAAGQNNWAFDVNGTLGC